MFSYHFKYELKSLLRNRWIQLLSVLLVGLCLFAAYNGKQKTAQRLTDIEAAQQEQQEADTNAIAVLDSIAAGHSVSVVSWQMPTYPQVVGNYYPRVAALLPAPLALVATGQSDLFTPYVKPTIRGEDFALNFTELASPVQLLFGSFDLAFVLIYLLPLIIIAFTYDMLSSEREQGSLRLLASQPLTLFSWLFQKAGLRFLILAGISSIALLLSLVLSGAPIGPNLADVGQLLALALGYVLFWFVVAFLINLVGKSSANNAVTLLALWVGLVLLIPSVVSQLANSLYPVPSRAQLVNDVRVLKAEAEKEQDKILDDYLRNHPELAGMDSTANAYWTRYFASQELVEQKMQPTLAQYETQLQQQQQWVNQLRFASPAIVLQDGLNNLAGTSSRHYTDFRSQVVDFAKEWRSFFVQLIFKNEQVTPQLMADLPAFDYRSDSLPSHFGANVGGLLLYSLVLLGVSFWAFSRAGEERIVTGM